jgi:glycosyltransferase involved in cell wall biosynthesis
MLYSNAFAQLPKVSIITSLFNATFFIDSFLQNIVKQTIFNQCELIIINANSPGAEDTIIKPYLAQYPNIIYLKLDNDPGLYGVWNMGIKMAKADYIINANVDDGLKEDALEIFANSLDLNQDIDMVYSDVYMTTQPNTSFDKLKKKGVTKLKPFSKESMIMCPPLNHPMWRKSIHTRFGFFDESYKSASDFEMWLRAVEKGSLFVKLEGVYGFFYINVKGLSHSKTHALEVKKILFQYRNVFNLEALTADKIMFEYYKAAAESFIWYK